MAALIWAGWIANGWRNEAARAKALAVQLQTETQKRIQGDVDRLRLQRELDARKEKVVERVKTITRTIVQHVPENPDCNLPDDVAGLVQRFREGQLSNPSK